MSAQSDPLELAKFNAMAGSWWDPDGDFRPLHDLNALRLSFIERHAELDGLAVLDVGCGAGLLSEAMARAGAEVTAIDLAEDALAAGRSHAAEHGVTVDYRLESAAAHAAAHPGGYDMVTCLELLEHVPDPAALIAACAAATRPGGRVFFSTLNRTVRAFVLGVVAAEYVLRLLPRGTHSYRRFIRPSELVRSARGAGLELLELRGMIYNPFSRAAALGDDVGINYIACFSRGEPDGG